MFSSCTAIENKQTYMFICPHASCTHIYAIAPRKKTHTRSTPHWSCHLSTVLSTDSLWLSRRWWGQRFGGGVWSWLTQTALVLNLVFYVKAQSIQFSSVTACLHLQWRHQEESCGSQSEPCLLISPSPACWQDCLSCQHTERDALHARWHHHHHHHQLIPNLQHQLNHGCDSENERSSFTDPGLSVY